MYINKFKSKILSIENEFKRDYDHSNQSNKLWIKVNVFNNSFLNYILEEPKFNGGEFCLIRLTLY